MGIIQRQSIKNSILNYLGAAIGAVSTFLIYPKAIEVHGLINFLKVTALLCVPVANLGIQTLVVRFFPKFRDPSTGHNGFLVFLLGMSALFFLVFLFIVSLFWEDISAFYLGNRQKGGSELIPVYLWYAVPLTFLLILINILIAYTSNFLRIVVPTLAYDFLMKLAGPVLILLYFYNYVSLSRLINVYLIIHVVIVLLLLAYLASLRELKLYRPTTAVWSAWKPMTNYAAYSLLGSLGALLATQLDTFMVGNMRTDLELGVYANSVLITAAIAIPQRAIFSITAPLVATSWENQDLEHIRQIYQKAAINLLLAGALLFILLNANLEDLCALIPADNAEKILAGKSVVFLLGLGIVLDMATSINGHIIYYSKYYRVSFYMILLLGFMNIGLNLYLIPRLGMSGAATATLISIASYNIAKVSYIYFRFSIQPFTANTLKLLLVILLAAALAWGLPSTGGPLLDLVFRNLIVLAVFGLLTYYWRISADANQAIENALAQIKRFVSR